MKRKKQIFVGMFIIASLIFQTSCTEKITTNLMQEKLIPKPVSMSATGESFSISEKTVIYIQGETEEMVKTGLMLASLIKPLTGFEAKVTSTQITPKKGIFLAMEKDGELGDEGYNLTITKRLLTLTANSPAGLFYGIQTLLQLLPINQSPDVQLATGNIRDFPYYSYRGAMLDVSRHFFDVNEVKQFIDFLAAYKMNYLHLHLSDDQGWRIEIKSWPNLATHGGSTEVGGGAGGFYTQEQYAELVKYAQERAVTIVPEIDMPGHTNAALSSYPELNCSGKATGLYTGTEVGFSSLCTGNEITYKFIDDVVRELAALTPGPYIHIGGDESHVTKIEDYIPFVNRVQQIVVSHGKKVIGWDEIANATLAPEATVQFWANSKNSTMGVGQGAKVLMSPASRAYLDMKYDSATVLGLHWAGYIEVDAGYNWNPETLVPGISKENILGIEAPLWSETVTNIDEVETLVFPRLPGYAEIGWTAPSARDWDEYKVRLASHGKRFEAKSIGFYKSPLVPWEE